MVVDLFPTDSLLGVYSQATLDEVVCLGGYVDARVVGTGSLDLLEDVIVTHALVGILTVKQLVIHHSQ